MAVNKSCLKKNCVLGNILVRTCKEVLIPLLYKFVLILPDVLSVLDLLSKTLLEVVVASAFCLIAF